MFDKEFYRGAQVWLVGSKMYRLNTPESDEDYVGVVFRPEMGLDPFVDPSFTETRGEMVLHSAYKLAKLIYKGNPNVLDLLYHEPLQADPVITSLIGVARPLAVHEGVVASYKGYVLAQKARGWEQSSKHGQREYNPTLGYDPKYIMHALRLTLVATGILETGTYYYLTEEELDFLRAVRGGAYPREQLVDILDQRTKVFDRPRAEFISPEVVKGELSAFFRKLPRHV